MDLNSVAPHAAGGLIHVIVDTPLGSRAKFKLDTATGLFKLSRILPTGLHFPCDFGFIPGTLGEDGDALDVALLTQVPSFPGCLVPARLIGLIMGEQTEKGHTIRNDRLLAVPVTPVNEPHVRDIRDVPAHLVDGIVDFFVTYNHLQGREFKATRKLGAAAADRALAQALPPGGSTGVG